MERRATPAKDKGVHGMPMMAWALPTNPNLTGEFGGQSANEITTKATANIVDFKKVFTIPLLFS